VNRYVVTRGEYKSLVLYWYQTPFRVIANEYAAKFYTVVDGLRHRRSDTSMVRLVIPVQNNDVMGAEKHLVRFAQDFFPKLREHLPRS
jgi:EpsI family protein